MAQHPANAGVLEEGCRALKLMAFSSAATRERVVRAGALPIVRRALESFPQDRWAAPPPPPPRSPERHFVLRTPFPRVRWPGRTRPCPAALARAAAPG